MITELIKLLRFVPGVLFDRPHVGGRFELLHPSCPLVWLAATEESWVPLLDAQNAQEDGDPNAGLMLSKLREAGRIYWRPIGTEVRVLEAELSRCLVEITNEPGRRGWVQTEYVKPIGTHP